MTGNIHDGTKCLFALSNDCVGYKIAKSNHVTIFLIQLRVETTNTIIAFSMVQKAKS